MTVLGASRQRWLPALVLPLLAALIVFVLGTLADVGGPAKALDRSVAAPGHALAVVAPPPIPSSASLPVSGPAAAPPLARQHAPAAAPPEPERRRGFSPVLERVEPAREPSGDAVLSNPPPTEPPTGTEVEVAPAAGPATPE